MTRRDAIVAILAGAGAGAARTESHAGVGVVEASGGDGPAACVETPVPAPAPPVVEENGESIPDVDAVPFMQILPVCPRCGRHLLWLGKWPMPPGTPVEVTCDLSETGGCGYRGFSPLAMPVPSSVSGQMVQDRDSWLFTNDDGDVFRIRRTGDRENPILIERVSYAR